MSEKYLWTFDWDCGRQGSVEGLFVATEGEVENSIGKHVYFGEILGKHSEVYGDIEEGEINKVNVDPSVIEQLIPHLGYNWSGYNPFDYIKCDECDEVREYCSCDEESEELDG